METTVCCRCGRIFEGKHYMIQIVEYLGQFGDRQPICDRCYKSFQNWMANPENHNGMTFEKVNEFRQSH